MNTETMTKLATTATLILICLAIGGFVEWWCTLFPIIIVLSFIPVEYFAIWLSVRELKREGKLIDEEIKRLNELAEIEREKVRDKYRPLIEEAKRKAQENQTN